MNQLSRDCFLKARDFLSSHGRPVDLALFRLHFEGGSRDDLLRALSEYQNADGGFGNGLEPDFQLPTSSAMATSVAFIMLRDAKIDSTPELVRRAVDFLTQQWDDELGAWPPLPFEVNDHPHAPWWSRSPDSESEPPPPDQWGNPNAELVGVLIEHATLVDASLLQSVTQQALARLDATPAPIGAYVALSYLRFAAVAPPSAAEQVVARLQADAANILDLDRDKLAADHFPPYWLAPTPDAPLATALADVIQWDLDRQIELQTGDGSWSPPWSWGPDYPDAWEKARAQWQSELTVRTLRFLAAYGRIDGVATQI